MFKIITVVGARPQFIKASVVSREISKFSKIQEVLLHSGQHFDYQMSDSFFDELQIPKPRYNLAINSLSHGEMTGLMIIEMEKIYLKEKPNAIIVYGDTDSTLAGAIAASKLGIDIIHIEAGLRSFNRDMPEEINRVVTDSISNILFTPSKSARRQLLKEQHKKENVIFSGDVMLDSCKYFLSQLSKKQIEIPDLKNFIDKDYIFLTIHRKDNTTPENFKKIIDLLNFLSKDIQIIWPAHPRLKKLLKQSSLGPNIKLIEPQPYINSLLLIKNSSIVITDSGGLQKEAFFIGKQCIVLRSETEWNELVELGWSTLVDIDNEHNFLKKIIIDKIGKIGSSFPVYGKGYAGKKIVKHILERYKIKTYPKARNSL